MYVCAFLHDKSIKHASTLDTL